MRGDGKGFVEFDFSLPIDDAFGVELWDARDWGGGGAGVEIDYLEVGVFEWKDYRVGWEDGEVGVEFVEEMKFVDSTPYAVGEEEDISLASY